MILTADTALAQAAHDDDLTAVAELVAELDAPALEVGPSVVYEGSAA